MRGRVWWFESGPNILQLIILIDNCVKHHLIKTTCFKVEVSELFTRLQGIQKVRHAHFVA